MNYLKKRMRAFGFAFSGIVQAFKNETHLKLHAVTTLLVIGTGFYFCISVPEWFMILSVITLVICLEMINSALEKLCDKLVPERDPKIKYIKDVAAGAVLIACILSVVIGLIVFVPHLCNTRS